MYIQVAGKEAEVKRREDGGVKSKAAGVEERKKKYKKVENELCEANVLVSKAESDRGKGN